VLWNNTCQQTHEALVHVAIFVRNIEANDTFLTDSVLFIAGVVNLAVGTWSALHQSATIAVTSLTGGLVLLFAASHGE